MWAGRMMALMEERLRLRKERAEVEALKETTPTT
jgi:hypothetical protein